MSQNMPI